MSFHASGDHGHARYFIKAWFDGLEFLWKEIDCPVLAHSSYSFFNLEIISAREKADIGDHAAKGLEQKTKRRCNF
jgi:hypothetical protein